MFDTIEKLDLSQQNAAHKMGCEARSKIRGEYDFIGYVGKSVEIALYRLEHGDVNGALATLKRADAFRQGWELAG